MNAGNLKEWSLTLYGTSEDPYHPRSSQQSSSENLDVLSPEVVLDLQEDDEEEEEEYNGEKL